MDFYKSRFIIFILFLVYLHRSFVSVEAQSFCFQNGGNYTANSVYQTNLNSLLSSLPANIGNTGFLNSSAGQGSDRVNAIAFCRADLQLEDCRNCIGNATLGILNTCPFRREVIFYLDNCVVRFSNGSIVGALTESPGILLRNLANASDVQQFRSDLRGFLDNLRPQAAAGGPLLKVAAGNRSGSGNLTIYSLVQCTPDISADDCDTCLSNAAQRIPSVPPISFRALFPSCMLRYETAPFFNSSRIQEVEALSLSGPSPPLPSPTLLPVPSPPTQLTPAPAAGATRTRPGGDRSTAIIICVVVGLLVL